MAMIRTISTLIISLFLLLASTSKALAVTVVVNSSPATISSDAFEVNASVSGVSDGTNFLRIDLYKDATTNYFGETYNGSTWISGSDGTQYFPIQIQNASASATFQGRLGNPSVGDYPGPGSYKLKIRRYTSSGSSYTFSESVDIQITYSSPTPSPTPVAQTQTPATSPPTVAPTKSPTPLPTKTPTPKPSKTPPPSPSPEVLGEEASPEPETPTPSPLVTEPPKKKLPIVPIVLISSGLLMIGFAVLQLIRASKNSIQT
ncbi:MAG: hypothetical protein AAB535_03700 [Patescibacteria group bacterium]